MIFTVPFPKDCVPSAIWCTIVRCNARVVDIRVERERKKSVVCKDQRVFYIFFSLAVVPVTVFRVPKSRRANPLSPLFGSTNRPFGRAGGKRDVASRWGQRTALKFRIALLVLYETVFCI